MNKLILPIIATGLLSISYTASAERAESNIFQPNERFYAGAMIQQNLHSEDSADKFEPNSFVARFGYNFNPKMAVEMRLGSSSDADELGHGVSREMDSLAGIYAVGTMPINRTFELYALIGASTVELTTSHGGGSYTDDYSGVSFGAGLNIRLTQHFAVNFEGMDYVDKDGINYGGVSAGVKFSF